MSTTPKVKIERIYRHPKTKAIVVHFNFDFGYRGNINIPPSMMEGLTKEQTKQTIKDKLKGIYIKQKRISQEDQTPIDEAITELTDAEIND